MARVTFTLDDATIATLRRSAKLLRKPQSHVLRDAIADYATRSGQFAKRERVRLLDVFDQLIPELPRRPVCEVDAELAEIRAARRTAGRRQ